jgi:Na+/H+-translocating membrane pyrophosphatase
MLGRVAVSSGRQGQEGKTLVVLLGGTAAAVLGVLFFFAIIGVFGMAIAVLALLAFIASAVFIVGYAPRCEVDP